MTITEEQMRGIAAQVVQTYVDVDGAAGNQCWDSATYINEHFFGLPRINCGGAGRWPGWAGNMVDAFPQTPEVASAYELVSPEQPCRPGDTLVWGDSYPEWYPKTHVATCVADPGNGWPLCLSQNSSTGRPDLPGYSPDSTGPIILQSLPKQGLIGIIRPRDAGAIDFQSIPASQEDTLSDAQVDAIVGAMTTLFKQWHDGTREEIEKKIDAAVGELKKWVIDTVTAAKETTILDARAQIGTVPNAVLGQTFTLPDGTVTNLAGILGAILTKPAPAGTVVNAPALDPQAIVDALVGHVNIQITKK